MYIEKSKISITRENKELYKSIIKTRKAECNKESQLKRLERSWKQIDKI